MIEEEDIMGCQGIKIKMPNANFLLIKGSKGYIMCGYLNMQTAEKLGDAACRVTGVDSFEDILGARIIQVSSKASKLGISQGMIAEDALRILR